MQDRILQSYIGKVKRDTMLLQTKTQHTITVDLQSSFVSHHVMVDVVKWTSICAVVLARPNSGYQSIRAYIRSFQRDTNCESMLLFLNVPQHPGPGEHSIPHRLCSFGVISLITSLNHCTLVG